MHMISIYTRPGIRTGDKGGRAACLGFGQSRVVAGFGGVRAEPHGAGDLPGRQINENVTRKLGLAVPFSSPETVAVWVLGLSGLPSPSTNSIAVCDAPPLDQVAVVASWTRAVR